MRKTRSNLCPILLVLLLSIGSAQHLSAGTVELKGKVIQLGGSLPATLILRSYGDEGYMPSVLINKDSTFSIKVDVTRVGVYSIRIMRASVDVMLSATEPTTSVVITLNGDVLRDFKVENSHENDAYTALKALISAYDPKMIAHFRTCEGGDSCERDLNFMLVEYAHEMSRISQTFKGTYTGDVLCQMKMPVVAHNVKNTTEEFRKGYFEKVDYADPAIFSTPVFKDMLSFYISLYMDAAFISKQKEFLTYITNKFKSDPALLHKGAGLLFDYLLSAQREKMLVMFIDWYNSGDIKASVNSPVLDSKVKNVVRVLPGMPYIDMTGTDTGGVSRSLKEVVDRSRCTLFLFWSSECSHCRDEMPYIKEYYEKYHGKGFDVFAMSMENDPGKWKRFITEKGLPWTNVITDRTSNHNPIVEYVANSTPAMVLIDSRGIILHRFMPKSKLEDHIIEALK